MKLRIGVRVGAGRVERVADVADELEAGEFVDEGEAVAATFVVLGERAAGDAPMKEVRSDRDKSEGGRALGRVALHVGESEQLAEDHSGRPSLVALGPGQKRWHRSPVERGDADIGSRHGWIVVTRRHAGGDC